MILLTGSSGFLGKTVFDLYQDQIVTLNRTSGDYKIELENLVPVFNQAFDVVIHAAGKAHINPSSSKERQHFFDVNVNGTKNLIKGLEMSVLPKSFIFISSVAVYGKDTGCLIKEDEPLEAKDPYGLSKIMAEELIGEWCKNNNVVCSILRLPLIAGPNPPGNLGIMIQGIKKGFYFNIAGGKAQKSVVLGSDVAKILGKVAEIGGTYNLTDGYHPSFYELSVLISKQLKKKEPLNMPWWVGKSLALIGNLLGSNAPINELKLQKITSDLTFDDSKARELLGWDPMPVLKGFTIS